MLGRIVSITHGVLTMLTVSKNMMIFSGRLTDIYFKNLVRLPIAELIIPSVIKRRQTTTLIVKQSL